MTTLSLEPMDLAAMLCSRVCHDLISPVGAIMNGLEVLDDEKETGMREIAIDLIRKSANGAAAKLKFCRLAYGAAGSAGATIDTGDAEAVARGLLVTERVSLQWNGARLLLPKNKVKLLLNLSQIAASSIPRGGVLTIDILGADEAATFTVSAKGVNAKIQPHFADLLRGEGHGPIEGHSIQPYYAALVARECGLSIEIVTEPDTLTFVTRAGATREASAA